MKVKIEILSRVLVHDKEKILTLNEKELIKKMILRRRFSRSSKILVYLASQCGFKKGCVVYGSAYGELVDSVAILEAIKDEDSVSPSSFQNSVYNTAASYHSILEENKDEIYTLSSGDNTSYTVMQEGALALHRKDEVFVCAIEAMNFKNVEVLNKCNNELEYGIAFVIKKTDEEVNIVVKNSSQFGVPASLQWMKNLYDLCQDDKKNIIEIEL